MLTDAERLRMAAPIVLAEHVDADGIVWQARIGADRGRLECVAVIPPREAPIAVQRLSDAGLQQLLAATPADAQLPWVCLECSTTNEPGRRWCRVCSAHEVA
jgi:hypothetical protein